MRKLILLFIVLLSNNLVYSQTIDVILENGDSKFNLKDFKGAISEYSKGIEILLEEITLLETELDSIKDYNDSEHISREGKLIKNRFYLNEVYKRRGDAWFQIQDFQEAQTDFSKALEINPKDSYSCFYRGIVRLNLLDFQGSIIDFSKSIQIDASIQESYLNRGIAKYKLQDFRGAVLDFSKFIEINPEHTSSYYSRGMAKYNLEDYRGAIIDFSRAIVLDPNDKDAYYNRGLSKYSLNQIDGCCLDLSKAGELGHEKAYKTIQELCN